MKYRVTQAAIELAANVLSKEDRYFDVYLKNWKKYSLLPLILHPRLSSDVAKELATGGINTIKDLIGLTPRAVARRASLNNASLSTLTSYLLQLELLSDRDPWRLDAILDPSCSTNIQLVAQSQVLEFTDYQNAPTLQWSISEQKLFCSIFFGRIATHRVAREHKLSTDELNVRYGSLIQQLGKCRLVSKLRDACLATNYRVINRETLNSILPELQISLFPDFSAYHVIDLLVRLETANEAEDYIDWTRGLAKLELVQGMGEQLLTWDEMHAYNFLVNIHPDSVRPYLRDAEIRFNETFLCSSRLSSIQIVARFLELQGNPISRAEIQMKLGGLLEKSINTLITESQQVIIPITKDQIALSDWGFDLFLGAKTVITDYLRQHGPTHLELLFAILDGFGYSNRQIKSIASSPPFFVQDDVCYLMD